MRQRLIKLYEVKNIYTKIINPINTLNIPGMKALLHKFLLVVKRLMFNIGLTSLYQIDPATLIHLFHYLGSPLSSITIN